MFKKIFSVICALAICTICFSLLTFADDNARLIKKDGNIYCMDGDKYITGWKEIDEDLYFFKKTGEAVTKSTSIGGIRYKFSSDGVCKGKYTGWARSGKKRFYYIDGIKQIGWSKLNDGWHYFNDKDGSHTTNSANICGKTYNFSSDGVWDGIADNDYKTFYNSIEKNLSKDDYGGLYFDYSVLIIMSKNDKNVKIQTEKLKTSYTPFVVKQCKFSINELEQVRTHLSKNAKKYGIATVSTDIMNNRIEVKMLKDNSKFSDYINSLDDSDIVYIKHGNGEIVED